MSGFGAFVDKPWKLVRQRTQYARRLTNGTPERQREYYIVIQKEFNATDINTNAAQSWATQTPANAWVNGPKVHVGEYRTDLPNNHPIYSSAFWWIDDCDIVVDGAKATMTVALVSPFSDDGWVESPATYAVAIAAGNQQPIY